MNTNFVVNIGRQLGSGGREIGAKLAGSLQIAFYDKELINLASKESGLSEKLFEAADEKTAFSLKTGVLGLRSSVITDGFTNNYLCNETLFKIQSDVIRELAGKQSCVFVGRCADYILRDHPRTLNVFICAGLEDRIRRVAKNLDLPEKKARELIEKTDKKRAAYYNYYSNKQWGAASTYHLCINSSVLGIEATVDVVRQVLDKKLNAR
ncbi:MAG: cytidylate kinase-like family protein [Prevotellaceae bacterium]|nr:cytidylate kinase-like family protein [Prevotellaceae bacterium]